MTRIYLDNNATTRPDDRVVNAVNDALKIYWANPSSVHRAGQQVRQQMELARQQTSQLIGCTPRELVFTAGGTEAATLSIRGSLEQLAGKHRSVLVTNALEHSAVRELAERLAEHGTDVTWLALDSNGLIDLDSLTTLLAERAEVVALVSVMWANNETGVIQPSERIGKLCRDHGVRFHVDGTQWVGKMPTDISSMPVDLMSFAAHKFHGPKGVGGLYIRKGARVQPQIVGGPQERQVRAGTENVPGIIGMGAAAEAALEWLQGDERARLEQLRNRFELASVERIDGATINGAQAPRLWNTTNIAFPRLEAEAILLLLSERGIDASAGAACSSGSLDPSPVLLAMGIPAERAHGSVRFSLSRETTDDEIDQAIEIIPAVIEKLRASMTAV